VEKLDLLLGFLKSNENWDAKSAWQFHHDLSSGLSQNQELQRLSRLLLAEFHQIQLSK
jgi:hypothetical protein